VSYTVTTLRAQTHYALLCYADVRSLAHVTAHRTVEQLMGFVESNLNQIGVCTISRTGESAPMGTVNALTPDTVSFSVLYTPNLPTDTQLVGRLILQSLNYQRTDAEPTFTGTNTMTDAITGAADLVRAGSLEALSAARVVREVQQGTEYLHTHSSDSYVGRAINAATNAAPTLSTDPQRDGHTPGDLAAHDAGHDAAQAIGGPLTTGLLVIAGLVGVAIVVNLTRKP
jgi:hypothetical protein